MRPLLLACLLLFDAAGPAHLRYQRVVQVHSAGQSCVVLDPSIYAHAAPTLADLRLFDGNREVPYVLTLSGTTEAESVPARVTNLQEAGHTISFDLAMPARPYTDVVLDLNATNFLARASVTAGNRPSASLGEFTLFDQSARHLPRSTTLHLQETSAPVLHIVLHPAEGTDLAASSVVGASVPPNREAQTLFDTAMRTSDLSHAGQETHASFLVPAHLPIERVRVTLVPAKTENFRSEVHIAGHLAGESATTGEQVAGMIGHLRQTRAGYPIAFDQLTVPATLGANLQQAAVVDVTIDDAEHGPPPIASIALETRRRQLCFVSEDAHPLTLFYGDSQMEAPEYPYARGFQPGASSSVASLGPETRNPGFSPQARHLSLTRRHPRLISLGFILLVCAFAIPVLSRKKLRL